LYILPMVGVPSEHFRKRATRQARYFNLLKVACESSKVVSELAA